MSGIDSAFYSLDDLQSLLSIRQKYSKQLRGLRIESGMSNCLFYRNVQFKAGMLLNQFRKPTKTLTPKGGSDMRRFIRYFLFSISGIDSLINHAVTVEEKQSVRDSLTDRVTCQGTSADE